MHNLPRHYSMLKILNTLKYPLMLKNISFLQLYTGNAIKYDHNAKDSEDLILLETYFQGETKIKELYAPACL